MVEQALEFGAGDSVGEAAFEAVADLDPELPVLDDDDEDHTVVEALPADPPLLGQADADVLEVLALERAEDRHRDLVADPAVLGRGALFEAGALGGRQDPRVVVDTGGGCRREREREREDDGSEQS
jgi:hypothetical protein